MRDLIPKTVYTSYASPLIKKHSEILIKDTKKKSFIISNLFPKNDFEFTPPFSNKKLQLVWFSQNINKGRGLEEFLSSFYAFTDWIELTLIGNPQKEFYNQYIHDREGVRVIGAMHPATLNKEIGYYDIGLAIEPGKDLNNTLALSNKILTYFQSGLFILATDTDAQKLFMEQHASHGICSSFSNNGLTETLSLMVKNKEEIRQKKEERFLKASEFNWESESLVLKSEWEKITG
jgi:hypothetical protein